MKLVKNFFLFFLLFPFVTPIKFGFDSQPWAFLFAIIILLNIKEPTILKIPKYYLGFFVTLIFALFSISFNFFKYHQVDIFSSFRSVFSILSIPICLLALINSNFSLQKLAKAIEYSVYVYFMVSLIQFFIPSFLTNFISRGSTSDERGLFSLTPEPVEYARTCFLILINLIILLATRTINQTKFRFLSVLLFIQALLFSVAGTAFIWALIYLILVLINTKMSKFKLLFLSLLIIFILEFLLNLGETLFPDKRVFNLLKIAQENPQFLTLEGGFVLRLLNPIHSIYVGIILNHGIGIGLGFISSGQYINYEFLGEFFESVKIEVASRSHGGLVGLAYELGFFSIPFIYSFLRISYLSQFNEYEKKWILTAFYFFMILVAFDGPLSSANVALTLGMFYIFRKRKHKLKPI